MLMMSSRFRTGRTATLAVVATVIVTALIASPERLIQRALGTPHHFDDQTFSLVVPESIAVMLQQACADCHSPSTRWPWYAAVPPLNFVLASHVRRGREEFELPHWRGTASSGRAAWMNLGASCYDVRQHLMPPRGYALLHPNSRWSASEIERFCRWAEQTRDSLRRCDRDSVQVELQELMRRMHARNPVPGISAAISVPDHLSGVLTAVSGARSASTTDTLSPDDRFLAGSVGKMFFAALALKRSAEGRLSLDTPIRSLLPKAQIASFEWITPRMLLTHTSGVAEYDSQFMQALIADPTRVRTDDDWLDVVRRNPPARTSAGTFRYSDLNYVLLAMTLEALEPNGAYAAIQRDILLPLGLTATTPSVTRRITGLVSGYDGPSSMFGRDAMMENGALIYNPQFEWGGGGFASTPRDLSRFTVAFVRGQLFPDSMWSHVVARPPGVSETATRWRGMGVHVDSSQLGRTYGHSGYMPGYVSWVRWYESLRVSVAMQVNATDTVRLVDDGFDWLDSMATMTARRCRTGG